MIKPDEWICDKCGKEAHIHKCVKKKHMYLCWECSDEL